MNIDVSAVVYNIYYFITPHVVMYDCIVLLQWTVVTILSMYLVANNNNNDNSNIITTSTVQILEAAKLCQLKIQPFDFCLLPGLR